MTVEKHEEDNGSRTFVRITNEMVWTEVQAVRADVRALATTINDYAETKNRVRKLELRFYGILAGLITALVVVAKAGGAF